MKKWLSIPFVRYRRQKKTIAVGNVNFSVYFYALSQLSALNLSVLATSNLCTCTVYVYNTCICGKHLNFWRRVSITEWYDYKVQVRSCFSEKRFAAQLKSKSTLPFLGDAYAVLNKMQELFIGIYSKLSVIPGLYQASKRKWDSFL